VLSADADHAYTFYATLLFAFAVGDLVFVLLTGRLRLGARYEDREFSALDVRTGRVAGSFIAATVLTLLIWGALAVGFGHTIQTGLSWFAIHGDDLKENLRAVI
jgi:hypothetical protein